MLIIKICNFFTIYAPDNAAAAQVFWIFFNNLKNFEKRLDKWLLQV